MALDEELYAQLAVFAVSGYRDGKWIGWHTNLFSSLDKAVEYAEDYTKYQAPKEGAVEFYRFKRLGVGNDERDGREMCVLVSVEGSDTMIRILSAESQQSGYPSSRRSTAVVLTRQPDWRDGIMKMIDISFVRRR